MLVFKKLDNIHSFLGLARGSRLSSVTQVEPHTPQHHRQELYLAEPCSFPPLRVISRLSGRCLKCRFANPAPANKLVSTSFTKRRELWGNARPPWMADGTQEPQELQHPPQPSHTSSFGSCGVQKTREGGDQAQLRPNSLSSFLCHTKSFTC